MSDQQMVSNKYYIGKECIVCDNEGIVSECCRYEIKFISNGAAKCVRCRKICRIDYCKDCKEESKCIVLNEKDYPLPKEQLGKLQRKKPKYYYLIIIVIVVFLELLVPFIYYFYKL